MPLQDITETPPWSGGTKVDDFDGPCIIIYRPHGRLTLETAYIGPFDDYHAAYEALGQLPALGPDLSDSQPGEKWIAPLRAPR
jgi:hypothetical protein